MQLPRIHLLRLLASAASAAFFLSGQRAAVSAPLSPNGDAMERVTGIGGFFFRARDPESLAKWYDTHLGVVPVPANEGAPVWRQAAGVTVFAPFPDSTTYFGDMQKTWMINFRVANLDRMVRQLEASGISVKVNAAEDANGKFAHLLDPEGNPIELWQPAEPA